MLIAASFGSIIRLACNIIYSVVRYQSLYIHTSTAHLLTQHSMDHIYTIK